MVNTDVIKNILDYISEVDGQYRTGDAGEHAYRPALKALLESLISGAPGLTVINEPKHIDCGAPDYIITKNKIPVGYVEAKDIGANLNGKEYREQFDRYKKALGNLIITDYLTFQLFVNGEPIASAAIAVIGKDGIEADNSQFEAFAAIVNKFIGYRGRTIGTPEQLSKIMAGKARFLAHAIHKALIAGEKDNNGAGQNTLRGQLEGFRKVLIHDMTEESFSDVYAQTVAYGMFAAKINNPESHFDRKGAAESIAPANPFLRNFFHYIAGFDLDERIRWVVDDLADLFNYVNIDAVREEFERAELDPIVHFYETFLSEYDCDLRKERGVWYTPQPIVRFIVQAVDDILTRDFNLAKGLADESKVRIKKGKEEAETYRVQILDPAAGTGTFLAEAVNNVYRRFKNQAGAWQSYAENGLLPRINGFEVLMAPYTIAHIKLDMVLQKTGYRHPPHTRQRIYLTNSLERLPEDEQGQLKLDFLDWLSNEASEAINVKENVPVMVVFGNPPYSGESQNTGRYVSWLDGLLDDYKKEPGTGERLNERNSKWLNDDYVKFIRYGQRFIENNDGGILAFINNHGFLDNPTFRGMRYNLLKTFDRIYVLDLHGNAKKKESAPDGGKDENVFNIQQGVSVNIFVKTGRKADGALADVFYYDLYGRREKKFGFLLKNSLESVRWRKLKPRGPMYFFVHKNFARMGEYEKGFDVQELFQVNSVGVVTGKDSLFVNTDKKALLNNIRDFKGQADKELVRCVDYRPFDTRYIYFDTDEIERARENVMRHFLNGENIGLITIRRNRSSRIWNFVFLSDGIVSGATAISSLDINYVFPLYLYPVHENGNGIGGGERRPNLKEGVINEISRLTKLRFTAEKEDGKKAFAPIDVLDYIYGTLHSPAYRERYREFLKIDFPRVPYPADAKDFWAWAAFGGKLRRLHLMEGVEPKDGIADFPLAGTNEVEKLKYAGGKVFINDAQYFNRVPLEAWEFYIGGYQPAQKWLKDRKGRTLGHKDIEHYQKIVRVLAETEKLMRDR